MRVKLTQHWESNWLNIESQIDSTLRVILTQHWESNWLNIESQIDSTLRLKLTQHWESNWLKYSQVTHFARSNYDSARDSIFKVKFYFRKWLNFLGQNYSIFLSVHWENIEYFWPKKLGQILVPPVTQLLGSNFSSASDSTLRVKMIQFFLSVNWAKKLSHFDLKSWVEFYFRQWLNFLSQNDSISYLCSLKRIESFWPKKLGQILVPTVTQLLKSKLLNIFSWCTERKNWVILT